MERDYILILEGVVPWEDGSEEMGVAGHWAPDVVQPDGAILARFRLKEPLRVKQYANIKCAVTSEGDTEDEGKLPYNDYMVEEPGGKHLLLFRATRPLPASGRR